MKYLVNRKTKEHTVATREDMMLVKEFGLNSDVFALVEADSEGWIPHTGDECPLPDDVRCDAVMETGSVVAAMYAYKFNWLSVVAYRPILAEKAQEPEPTLPADCIETPDLLDRLKAAHEAARTIPELESELREVLAGMGYDLVARSPFVEAEDYAAAIAEPEPAVETPQDMSDWRNWREGDLVEVINQYYDHCFSIGRIVRIANITNSIIDCEADGVAWSMGTDELRFHSRPAKGEK